MRSISFQSPKDIIKCHFALFFTRICKSRNDPRNSIIVEKLFKKLNSVENRDREISFRFFETENREMGCHSRIENDFAEISTTLFRSLGVWNIFGHLVYGTFGRHTNFSDPSYHFSFNANFSMRNADSGQATKNFKSPKTALLESFFQNKTLKVVFFHN